MPEYTQIIADESQRFLDVLAQVAPDVPVPSCPDWNAADLRWHLAQVHAFWAEILRSGALTDEQSEAVEEAGPQRPQTQLETETLFRTATEKLLEQLASKQDSAPAWFWLSSTCTVGATRRMQAHEATIHRVDAELTAGVPVSPVTPALAGDGIRHAVDTMFAWWSTLPGFSFTPVSGVVALEPTDGERLLVQPGRWTGVGQSGKHYDEPGLVLAESGEPVATISGTAVALYLWLWSRGEQPHLEGDQSALDAVSAVVASGMQ